MRLSGPAQGCFAPLIAKLLAAALFGTTYPIDRRDK